MRTTNFLLLLFVFVSTEGNPLNIMLSMRELTGCFDFVWEIECDTKIHILWENDEVIGDWRILATTSTIMNNNNPVWPEDYPIPSNAKSLKFQVFDVDLGIDDLIGYTRVIPVEEIRSNPTPHLNIPIGGGEGSGILRITKFLK